MSAAELIPVPDPRRQDIEDVQCALAVAAARWEHGDREDALRWLRRAARAAADHEQLERALELSKAAVEMSRRMSKPPPPPRQSRPAPRQQRLAPVARIGPPRLPPRPAMPQKTPSPTRPDRNARGAPTFELPSILSEEDPTIIRFVPSAAETRPDLPAMPALPSGPLSAARVAVMRDPATGRPTMMVLPPNVRAPAGSAVAMLVASTSEDTAKLGKLLEDFVLEDSVLEDSVLEDSVLEHR